MAASRVEPSREHGESPERDAPLRREVVAPVKCCGERLLAVEMTTLARGEYRQGVAETIVDLRE
jgi:hypothetical protein